ncbi:hypothetical protein NP493_348g02003 [Ridgeia piscesae]|uniref:Uncharacterized protein n=1 Tax=Ridgeia piscesae TaxID=27915 RepID=A0AAD9L4M6_RIDPI|nr:hypothetical protein NP493_348g02003 [Ridgeia piscesae]
MWCSDLGFGPSITESGSSTPLVKPSRYVQTRLAHWQKQGPSVTLNSQTDAPPLATTDQPFVVSVSLDAKTLQLHEHGKDDLMRQASSGQWLYNPASLSASFTIQSAKLQEETVLVEWSEEPGHCSVIPLVYLLSNDYSPQARQERHDTLTPTVAKVELLMVWRRSCWLSGGGAIDYLEEELLIVWRRSCWLSGGGAVDCLEEELLSVWRRSCWMSGGGAIDYLEEELLIVWRRSC